MLDRSIKPIPTGKIQFTTPNIEKFFLENSAQVYFNKKDNLPIIQLNLIIPCGSIYNPNGKEGLSFLTSMLLDEGADNLSGFEISDKLELMGSILNINSNKEFTTISLLCLKEKFENSLEILSKIILHPNFNDDDFERQKLKLVTKNIQLEDDPSYVASNIFNKKIFKNTNYQFPSSGINSSIESITNSDIKNFHSETYLPIGSFFVIVGNIEKSNVANLLNKYFEGWKNQNRVNHNFEKIIFDKKIIAINKPEAVQSELRIGHFSKGRNSDDFYSRSLLNSILGGQFSSRINLNLREAKGFTYGANSNYNYNSLGSTFSVSTSVKSENTGDSIKEILFELNEIKNIIHQHEIDFAKSYLVRRFPSMFETYSQIASNISLLPLYNLPQNYFDTYIRKLSEVELNDVLKAAKENIDFDKLLIVVVGNLKLIEEQIAQFDEFEIEKY
ncbi:MAG: insulinase family protein [Ignavibacteriae bacterium]|nr:insulinase family protein [Ignavibacteriota bacterium]